MKYCTQKKAIISVVISLDLAALNFVGIFIWFCIKPKALGLSVVERHRLNSLIYLTGTSFNCILVDIPHNPNEQDTDLIYSIDCFQCSISL